jgi:hypothetical protein
MQLWTELGPDALDVLDGVRPEITDAHQLRDGRWRYRMTLKLTGSTPRNQAQTARYQRRGHARYGERAEHLPRVAAVCWHGYRDWMRRIFDLDPAARMKTAAADYRRRSGFEELFEATGDRNIGSMMQPLDYRNACDCDPYGGPDGAEPEPEEEPEGTYAIFRAFFNGGREVIEDGLSLEAAQAHCRDPETSSTTATSDEAVALTAERGPWFDGYEYEDAA